ncbi:hypothetical protein C7477_11757 [Phyllobacterium leguminum]|uniref:Uncharacterized protein n=1 Tax=Phyllobacterium leguminum TaxID=314237 RepID=A0A318T2H8_9HYPH|nr:hypothetical protein C7477_11757 [Phyllobacterium leguminum]
MPRCPTNGSRSRRSTCPRSTRNGGAIGQHQIEHERVEIVILENGVRLLAGFNRVRRESAYGQAYLETVPQDGIILNNKYPHLAHLIDRSSLFMRLKAVLRIAGVCG